MIIVCPSCDSQFLVNAKAIGDGRTVKCSSCSHTWHQEPVEDDTKMVVPSSVEEDAKEEQNETGFSPETNVGEENIDDERMESSSEESDSDVDSDEGSLDEQMQADEDEDEDYLEESPDTMVDDDFDLDEVMGRLKAAGGDKDNAEPAMDPIPKGLGPSDDDDDMPDVVAISESEEAQPARNFSLLGAFVIFLAFVTMTALGGISYKDAIARAWPPSAGFFSKIGLPVHVVGEGLVLGDVTSMVQKNDGTIYLLIRGRIDNVSEQAITIPPFKVELYNDYGFVQEWVTPYEEFQIGSGESVPFEYGLPGIKDENPASVVVTFTHPETL